MQGILAVFVRDDVGGRQFVGSVFGLNHLLKLITQKSFDKTVTISVLDLHDFDITDAQGRVYELRWVEAGTLNI